MDLLGHEVPVVSSINEQRTRDGRDGWTLDGAIFAVENFGAGDLLEVERPDGRRSLIPFRDPMARLDADRVVVDPEFLA
jgi:hypothetical protein